jgi:hypothetical protein
MRFLVAVGGGENAPFSVNRSLDTVGVTGSNPVSRTTSKPLKQIGLHSRKDPETGRPQSLQNSRFLPFLGVFWVFSGNRWQQKTGTTAAQTGCSSSILVPVGACFTETDLGKRRQSFAHVFAGEKAAAVGCDMNAASGRLFSHLQCDRALPSVRG